MVVSAASRNVAVDVVDRRRRCSSSSSSEVPSGVDYVEVDQTPDGGWGWVVTAGVFIVFVITTGSSWAFGILYIAFLDAFEKSQAITAVPGSLIFMTMVVTNPYAGLLADKYGHRPVIFAGGLISSSAIFACSFVNDFTSLTILYGLIGGIGFGLSHLPAVVMLNKYFRSKIGTATGIAMAGTGVGTIFFSVVTQFLVNEYGWRGTMIVLSAINANLCVAAAVMRPLPKCRRPRVTVDETEDDYDDALVCKIAALVTANDDNCNTVSQDDDSDSTPNITSNPLHQLTTSCALSSQTPSLLDAMSKKKALGLKSQYYANISNSAMQKQYMITMGGGGYAKELKAEYDRETKNSCSCVMRACKNVFSFFDSVYGFDLWKDLTYLAFLMGINLAFFGFTVVSAHVAKRALEFGFHEYHSSSLVGVLGLSQAAGRFLSGPLIDRCRLNPMIFYQTMVGTCGVAIITSIYLPSFPAQVCFCAVAGYTTGACATLQTVMSGALFGVERVKFAYGGVIFAVGVAMLSSPPIAGLCRDFQGHYEGAFYLAAVSCFMSVVVHLTLTCSVGPGKKGARTEWEDVNEKPV